MREMAMYSAATASSTKAARRNNTGVSPVNSEMAPTASSTPDDLADSVW
jgi:hypothetical protein